MTARCLLLSLVIGGLAGEARPAERCGGAAPIEYALTIWNWTAAYCDFPRFRRMVDEAETLGFNTIELSVAWKDVQPEAAGKFDWKAVDRRVEYVLAKGLRLRVRINFAYARPWPKWIEPWLAVRFDGRSPARIMTIFDDRINGFQVAAAEAIVAHYRGRGIEWCPVFGVHTEHKLSSWLSYEPAARAAFRRWLRKQYGSLAAVVEAWGEPVEAWDKIEPPIVPPTTHHPDLRRPACDWITFREEAIAEKVRTLLAAVREADPKAATCVILGESFRRESAAMANLGYQPYSRHADRVVFAYDFGWHGPERPEESAVSLAIVRGVSDKPTVFEFGGPVCMERNGYGEEDLIRVGRLVLDSGAAGLNMCNYCYGDGPLSKHRHLAVLGREVAHRNTQPRLAAPEPTALYYVSKWANYALRDPKTEWVHREQFEPYRRLLARGLPVRVVTDDNLLTERFEGIEQLYVAPAPVIDADAKARLRELAKRMKTEPAEPLAEAVVLER